MPGLNKAGIDWPIVRSRYEAGETAYSLAQVYGVSQQGISKRAKKEGWQKGAVHDDEPQRPTSGMNWLNVVNRSFKAPVGDKDSPERRAMILNDLAGGMTLKAAAAGAGVDVDTLGRWRDADKVFGAQCEEAQASYVRARFQDVYKASERGDVKAATWSLERHPMTREDYGDTRGGKGGPSITVVLNVPAPMRSEPQPITLDVVADDAIPALCKVTDD